ncbi:MAG: TIGR00295 family protein [Candidatus Hydrothermarchaeales archaeon]
MKRRSSVLKKRFAIELLRKQGCSEDIIQHCLAVSNNALKIVDKVNIPVNRDLIEIGAILHDIGRCRTQGIDHVTVGGEIARQLGLPEEIARIIERHIGAGIIAEEARVLGLPPRDYIPITPEEKIVSYADNLTIGLRMSSFEESLERFKRLLGEGHPAVARFQSMHHELQDWIN